MNELNNFMDNELIKQRNVWQRYRNWILAIAILVVILSFNAISGVGENVVDMAQIYREPKVYEDALAKANQNARVIEKCGKLDKIDRLAVMEGNVSYSNENKNIAFTLRVSGAKMAGKMDVSAEKSNGEWIYKAITIRTKSPDEKINIIED